MKWKFNTHVYCWRINTEGRDGTEDQVRQKIEDEKEDEDENFQQEHAEEHRKTGADFYRRARRPQRLNIKCCPSLTSDRRDLVSEFSGLVHGFLSITNGVKRVSKTASGKKEERKEKRLKDKG